MSLISTLRFITNHPLNNQQKLDAVFRFIKWQVGSRILPGTVALNFVNDARLLVSPGMTGATGNIYTGLHEFEDMAFLLHVLRADDLFIDIGANVGSYTILAGKVVGAKCIAIEPIPVTFNHLLDNISLNQISTKVVAHNLGIGRDTGILKFTTNLDTVNHVITDAEEGIEILEVPVRSLDEIAGKLDPFLMKIDVEGFETDVVAGGEEVFSKTSLNAIIMELNGSGSRYGYDEPSLHQKIIGYGFSPYSYLPVKRELVSLNGKNSESGNTLYIRDIKIATDRIKSAPTFSVNKTEI